MSSFDTLELINKIERYLSPRVLLEYTYQKALKLYKSGKKEEAAKILLEKIGSQPWNVDEMNVCIFNDLGYFLEETKEYRKAIEVLEMVVSKFPERVVAWLNLGDAQVGLGRYEAARVSYVKYVELMQKEGKEHKIPQRVKDFLKR